MIRRYKVFFSVLEEQESWLNRMAEQGYRLVKTIFTGFLLFMAIFGRARLGFIENVQIVKLIENIARGFAIMFCIPVLFMVIKVFLRIRELKQENRIDVKNRKQNLHKNCFQFFYGL